MRVQVREYMVEQNAEGKFAESETGACVCIEFEENGIKERIIGIAPKLDTINKEYGITILRQILGGNGEWSRGDIDNGCMTNPNYYVNPSNGQLFKNDDAFEQVEVDYIDPNTGLTVLELEVGLDQDGREVLVPNTEGRTVKVLEKRLKAGLIPQYRYYELGLGAMIFGAFKMQMKKYYNVITTP